MLLLISSITLDYGYSSVIQDPGLIYFKDVMVDRSYEKFTPLN